jgi:thiol-disulfide isomerase/thioredoxin
MSRKQKALWLNIALFVAVGLLGYGLTIYFDNRQPPNVQQMQEEALPEFVFTDLSGKTHNVTDFQGKVILINFWATWCPPCVVEFPALLKIAAENEDVIFIALSSDLGDEEIKRFLSQQKELTPNVYIARDSEDVTLKTFGIKDLPETIIVGPDMTQHEKLIGVEWDPAVVQKIIDSL